MTVELASLGELEPALAAEGFFERDDVFAHVYVGYRASDAMRRLALPAPPEPCPLPAVAYSIERIGARTRGAGSFAVGDWQRTWSEAEYGAAVDAVRAAIAEGDVYQVNLVQHLSADFDGDPAGLAQALAPLQPLEPLPLEGDGWAIVSASPELLLSRRGRTVRTSPIKGTRPAGVPVESAKDVAEHVMIVDLERNDLSRVCVPGSVHWPELLHERQLAGVSHLVATVEGELRDGVTLTELLEAVLPGGSVTGCPKVAALDLIAALEPVGRGAAMGALGRIYPNGDLELALTIRTFAVAGGRIHLWVGGGIVWDSEPAAEVEESWVKARPLLQAIGAPLRRGGASVTLLAVAEVGRGPLDPNAPVLHADDQAVLRGRAVFETIRVYDGHPFRLDAHLRRLGASAERIGLPPVDAAGLALAVDEALAAGGEPDAVLRLLWTPGREGQNEPTGLALVSTLPSGHHELRERGLRLAVVPWAPGDLIAGTKSTSYAENIAAQDEAGRRGADDALFVALDGAVLEAPTSNVWWREERRLLTPSLELPILAGVTRATVIELASDAGYGVEEGTFPLERLLAADEAFLTSSIREVMPVVAVDDARIGDGRPGPAAESLQRALRSAAGYPLER